MSKRFDRKEDSVGKPQEQVRVVGLAFEEEMLLSFIGEQTPAASSNTDEDAAMAAMFKASNENCRRLRRKWRSMYSLVC